MDVLYFLPHHLIMFDDLRMAAFLPELVRLINLVTKFKTEVVVRVIRTSAWECMLSSRVADRGTRHRSPNKTVD